MTREAAQTALVLSGGGAYGALSIGVMKALFSGSSPATHYQPLQASLFAGTSVGAFNASIMAAHGNESSLDAVLRLEDIWINRVAERPGSCGNGVFRLRGDPSEYLDANCLRSPARVASNFGSDALVLGGTFLARTANFLASSVPLRDRALGLANVASFVDATPYYHLLRGVIVEEDIRLSPKRLVFVATNWVTGAAVRFTNSDFHDNLGTQAIAASSAIPGLFPPVQIGTDVFVDGGVVENTPLSPALDLGATELHVIYLDPNPHYVPLAAEAGTVDRLLRVYYVMLATKLNEDIETARWINSGLRALRQASDSGPRSQEQLRDIVRSAGQILKAKVPYKTVTIHRYFPRIVPGGTLGILRFDVDTVAKMIAEGERVALLHDCVESGCVVEDDVEVTV
jgi:predicted acylesterase/phospholipase RssA